MQPSTKIGRRTCFGTNYLLCLLVEKIMHKNKEIKPCFVNRPQPVDDLQSKEHTTHRST